MPNALEGNAEKMRINTERWSVRVSSGSQHCGPNLHSKANLQEISEVRQRSLCIIGVAWIFDWGRGPKHKSLAMPSSESFKKGPFYGQRYCRMKNQKPWPVLALSRILQKKEGLN